MPMKHCSSFSVSIFLVIYSVVPKNELFFIKRIYDIIFVN
jgi:hypothetical protein